MYKFQETLTGIPHHHAKINPVFFLPWDFTVVSSSRITELTMEMLLDVSRDCVLSCCSLTPAGCCFTHAGFGIGQVWQYKQRRGKKREKVLCCDQCSGLREGGGRSEKTADCTDLYILISALFLDCCATNGFSEWYRSHMWNGQIVLSVGCSCLLLVLQQVLYI